MQTGKVLVTNWHGFAPESGITRTRAVVVDGTGDAGCLARRC